jgi:hypothetical protein
MYFHGYVYLLAVNKCSLLSKETALPFILLNTMARTQPSSILHDHHSALGARQARHIRVVLPLAPMSPTMCFTGPFTAAL